MDGDGDYEINPYWSLTPSRPLDMMFQMDCGMLNARYGFGQMEGMINFNQDHPEGKVHGHLRLIITHPPRFDLAEGSSPSALLM